MGYQTVRKVPTLHDYAVAYRWWNTTKPIRGRAVEIRPLAERKYADCYSIRKNPDNNAIECVLYRTPVVSFMPDGEVHLRNDGWTSATTNYFMREVVGRQVSANTQKGRTMVRVGEDVVSLGEGEVIRLRREGSDYRVVNTQTHYDYKINRKAANIVRGRFKDFYAYFKGFVNLRSQENRYNQYAKPQMMIECTFAELAQTIGAKDYWDSTYDCVTTDKWSALTNKPGTTRRFMRVNHDEYNSTMGEFLDLIKSDQPEDTKYENFHKATLVLLAHGMSNIVEKKDASSARTVWLIPETGKNNLDTALFKWYANEVLERYEVPKGKVPSNKYKGWVEEENT